MWSYQIACRSGVAPLPVVDNRPELYGCGFVVGNVMGVARNSRNPEAAWQFVRFLNHESGHGASPPGVGSE